MPIEAALPAVADATPAQGLSLQIANGSQLSGKTVLTRMDFIEL